MARNHENTPDIKPGLSIRHPTPLLADLAAKAKPNSQTALMPGNGDKVGFWLTPKDLIEKLDAEFHFDFDACPYPRPGGFNGLTEPWGARTWLNPPFVGPDASRTAWARKAIEEHRQGKTVVMINAVDRMFMLLVEAGAEIRAPPPFTWLDTKGRPRPKGIARPSLLFILDHEKRPCGSCNGSGRVPR